MPDLVARYLALTYFPLSTDVLDTQPLDTPVDDTSPWFTDKLLDHLPVLLLPECLASTIASDFDFGTTDKFRLMLVVDEVSFTASVPLPRKGMSGRLRTLVSVKVRPNRLRWWSAWLWKTASLQALRVGVSRGGVVSSLQILYSE